MVNDTLIESAKRIDLLVIVKRDNNLHKVSGGEWAGPCPRCGGTDRFHVRADTWMCRQCHPRWSDPIGYLRWLNPGLTFDDAVAQLTSRTLQPTTPQQSAHRQREPQHRDHNVWAHRATVTLRDAQNRLLESEGEPGRDYLARRSLEPRVWLQFRLGYCPDVSVPGTSGRQRAPAIAIPWYAGGELVGVRYRFLGAQQGCKVTAEAGSQFAGRLFGGQGLPDWVQVAPSDAFQFEALCDLVICEGEVNAMSIWQTAGHTNLHVLSLGSEGAKLTKATVEFAQRYRHTLIWADKPEIARDLQGAIPGAHSFASPNGMDGNDLLRSGLLGAVLGMARLRCCRDDHEREGLLWDMWDAEQSWLGVDTGTKEVAQHIADGLGKTLKGGI